MQLNSSTENLKFDNGSLREPRFGYGPLLGLLLANFLSNSVIAKYAPLGALRLSYDPWRPSNPLYNHYAQDDHYSYWHPIKNPYGPPLPPTSTATGNDGSEQHIHHHHHIDSPPANQQQIVNINERPVPEIFVEEEETTSTDESNSEIIAEDDYHIVSSNIETPHIADTIAEESVLMPVQETTTPNEIEALTTLQPKKSVKRNIPSRQSKRRRYTTTPDYYDDSYEDFTTSRYKSRNKQKPKRPLDSYEDENDYDYEITTRPYKKRRRTTVKPKRNKNRNRRKPQRVTTIVNDYEEDYDYEPVTQIVILRQRQTVPPTETAITNGTTTETTTTSTTTTTGTTTTESATNGTGYGYGPSNGNEGISITYGPPQNQPQGSYGPPRASYGPPKPVYGAPTGSQYLPYSDWYSNEASRNAIVRKVNDIIAFDNIF